MSYESNEISGTLMVLNLAAERFLHAVEQGLVEPDTMLTPTKTAQVSRGTANAIRTIKKAQELFKRFEHVAEVRKEAVGV